MDLTTAQFLLNLAAAVGIGALIGIEREHRRGDTPVIAGVRTFPLISTAGFLTAVIGNELGTPWPMTLGTAAILVVALGFFYIRYRTGDVGFTTPMAIVVTYLSGALIAIGFLLEAIIVSIVTTFLLLTKDRLHAWAETMSSDEIMGALQFVAFAFVAFPLAAQADGPYLNGLVGDGRPIDLQWTVLIVVAASGLAFVSFLALRRLGGRRGLATAGALGGLVNSEAATASVATLGKQGQGLTKAASAAVVAATGTSLVRNLALAGFADPSFALIEPLTLLLLAPIAICLAGVVYLGREAPRSDPTNDIGLKSPFAIRPALTFAVVFTAVNAAAFFLQDIAGPLGVYATSLGAIVSSGAVVASAASLVFNGTLSVEVGLVTAGLATVIGFASKLGVVTFANREMLRHVTLWILAAGVATGLGLAVLV